MTENPHAEMRTFIACMIVTLVYLGSFYIWGKTFLGLIKSEHCLSESICFGFIIMHVVYQAFYLPFFFARGSYRLLSVLWAIISLIITVLCLIYNIRVSTKRKRERPHFNTRLLTFLTVGFIVWLCLLVGLHARYYHDDGYYIYDMDRMVYQDTIWHTGGTLDLHRGYNSFYALFATPCVIVGIRPFYIALFTLRFLGVALTALVAYRTGKIVFDRRHNGVSGYALLLSMIVPFAMMFWSSIYTGSFFYLRTNESKAYCLLVLLPLAFSVCIEPFFEGANRKVIWEKQFAIGLSAMPVAASSMSAYPLLIFVGAIALLAYDRWRNAKATALCAVACIVPNLVYSIFYIFR